MLEFKTFHDQVTIVREEVELPTIKIGCMHHHTVKEIQIEFATLMDKETWNAQDPVTTPNHHPLDKIFQMEVVNTQLLTNNENEI